MAEQRAWPTFGDNIDPHLKVVLLSLRTISVSNGSLTRENILALALQQWPKRGSKNRQALNEALELLEQDEVLVDGRCVGQYAINFDKLEENLCEYNQESIPRRSGSDETCHER